MSVGDLTIGSLFSGIGGLELGLERAGLGRVVWQVERDAWCRSVLEMHWPDAMRFDDVRTVGASALVPVDVICGGFPCQDLSHAGKRRGLDGERSGLWFEYARIVGELRPSIVVIENVLGLRTAGLPRVLADLAALGFDAEWTDLSAGELGAPHLRRRLFIVATDPDRVQLRDEPGWLSRACGEAAALVGQADTSGIDPDADGLWRLEQARRVAIERGWTRHVGWELDHHAGVDDGFPAWVDLGAARKALGNAVAVRCAEVIGGGIVSVIERVKEAA